MLTREQILALPAGRELDALIAEHVMGFSVYHYDKDVEANCYFMLMDGDFDPVYSGYHRDGERKTEAEAWGDCPHYSASLDAVWPAVDKMREKFTFLLWSNFGRRENGSMFVSGYRAQFDPIGVHRGYITGLGPIEDAPLATCKAALLALLESPATPIQKEGAPG